MKKNKLSLNDLKVNSFVTTLKDEKTQTIKGGVPETYYCEVVTFKLDCFVTIPLICG